MALMDVHLKDLTNTIRKKGHDLFAAGSNADVWLGVFIDPKGHPPQVAIKIIRSALSKEEAKKLNEKLLREARLWTTLNHVNIVPLLGVLTTAEISPSSAPGLVTPYYKNGTLTNYVVNRTLTLNDKMNLLFQVADGLAYLHSHKVIHADIKPGNILIDDGGQAVLADFGLSIVLETSGFTTWNTPGTTRYMAPELLDTQAAMVRPTAASDVWAFGIAATEIFSRRKPYENLTDAGVLINVSVKCRTLQYDDYSADIRSGLWSGLNRCWQRTPADRVSMSDLREFIRKKQSDYAAGK